MSVNTKFIPFILLALCITSCASNKLDDSVFQMEPIHNFKNAPLIGIVYSSNNVPCPEAEISIFPVSDDGVVKEKPQAVVQSDINGRFMIPEVWRGRHEILITKQGFEDGKIMFDFLDMTKVFYIQMKSLESLLDEAEEHLDRRNLRSAKDCISRAFMVDERSVEALYLQAVYYSLNEEPVKSQAVLDTIKEIDPGFNS